MLIHLESDTLRYTGVTLQNPRHIAIAEGLSVVIGPNGAGKTALAHVLERGWNFATNRITSPRGRLNVRYVEFNDIHSLAGFKAEYYQQRYESGMNWEVPTVADVLGSRMADPRWRALAEKMSLRGYENKPMNGLSSGELRKLLIINQLTDAPDLLILDNPYIGLDVTARAELDSAMESITGAGECNIMLLLCNDNEVPPFAAQVIGMRDFVIGAPTEGLFSVYELEGEMPTYRRNDDDPLPGSAVVEMRDCRIAYGHATILPSVNWTVRMGERWILSGRNGSGKSTLLSLIHADNPQGYSNNLSLFGRRRGTGESIWDIKRRIGYISPEMHLYFNGGHSLGLHVVAQGLNDTVGQYKKLTEEQLEVSRQWMRYLQISHLAERPFRELSSGEQRMLLLARTLIKQPPLLILDEPLHGLDRERKRQVRRAVNRLIEATDLTLIYVTHRMEEAPAACTRHKALS